MATGSTEVDRRVWMYNIKDGLEESYLEDLLSENGPHDFTLAKDKTSALITFDQKSDADSLVKENHDEFKTVKCNKTLWKGRADVSDKFSRFIEQLPTKQRQILNNTGAVRKRRLPNGVVLEGSLSSIHEFGDKLAGFVHSRYLSKDPKKKSPKSKEPSTSAEEFLLDDDKMPNVHDVLENISAEVAPWVFHLCPSVQSHIDCIQETAEVTISRKKDKLIVYGQTVDNMFRADSALCEFVFRGRAPSHDSPSHVTGSPESDTRKSSEIMPTPAVPPLSLHSLSPREPQINTQTVTESGSKRKKKGKKSLSGELMDPSSTRLSMLPSTSTMENHQEHEPDTSDGHIDISKCLEKLTFRMVTPEGVQVQIHMGDITEEPVDVIVNSANPELQHDSGVAKAISQRGGPSIQRESSKHVGKYGFLSVGSVCYTPPGNLPCRFVIHAVGPPWNEDASYRAMKESLHDTVLKVLEMASQRLGAHSIALPAVSTGNLGMPVDLCAQVFHQAITEFSSKYRSTKLQDIRIVINQSIPVGIFILEFYKAQEWSPISLHHESGGDTYRISGDSVPSTSYGAFTAPVSIPKSRSTRPRGTRFEIDMSPPKSSPPVARRSVLGSGSLGKSGVSTTSLRMMSLSAGDTTETDIALKLPYTGNCQICTNNNVVLLEMKCCKNTICEACFQKHFNNDGKCPFCTQVVLVKRGNQPQGYMTHRVERTKHLPGFKGEGTIVITYDFPDGVQINNHPHPGLGYTGTMRVAFLPAGVKGQMVFDLLQRAFDLGHLFTIGRSVTTGIDDCVVWNDVHHKTSRTGGPAKHGYPDPTYLDRVLAELAAKGIK